VAAGRFGRHQPISQANMSCRPLRSRGCIRWGITGRAFTLLTLLAIGLLSSWLAPSHAESLDFFATSAQVVPVLLLVLVLEARLIRFSAVAATRDEIELLGERTAARLTILNTAAVALTLFSLLWAEYAAFAALIGGEAADGNVQAVVRGLGVGFGAVVLLAFSGKR